MPTGPANPASAVYAYESLEQSFIHQPGLPNAHSERHHASPDVWRQTARLLQQYLPESAREKSGEVC
jgi:hypothetical protein